MSHYIVEQEPVYLDYNATTPVDEEVQASIGHALKNLWANPSSSNPLAKEAKAAVEKARGEIAQLLHVPSSDVFFTSGGTEGNNWLISSVVEAARAARPNELPHVIASAIEHPSILEPLYYLEREKQIELSLLPVDPSSGTVEVNALEGLLKPSTALVTVMYANNETGVIQPLLAIAKQIRTLSSRLGTGRRPVFHSDTAQALGKIDVNLQVLEVDAATVVGHKFYGPRIGALVYRSEQNIPDLLPLLRGGGQEQGLRSGTENTAMVVGLGTAARISAQKLSTFENHLADVRDYFEASLREALPQGGVRVHFASSSRLPNTSSVAFPVFKEGADVLLEKSKSFYASTGAACHADIIKISPILRACGIEEELAVKTVRFSFGRETTKEDVDRVVKELKALMFLQKHGSSLVGVFNMGPVPGF